MPTLIYLPGVPYFTVCRGDIMLAPPYLAKATAAVHKHPSHNPPGGYQNLSLGFRLHKRKTVLVPNSDHRGTICDTATRLFY